MRDCTHGQLARSCNICEMEQEIERLRAELAACQQDAERYRWLREKIEDDDFLIARASEWSLTSWCGDDPDRYIDAVLADDGVIKNAP